MRLGRWQSWGSN